jgi:hypothetical protein
MELTKIAFNDDYYYFTKAIFQSLFSNINEEINIENNCNKIIMN